MSEEIKNVHDFEYSLICEYFSYMDRQGPGSSAVTKLAMQFVPGIESFSEIADIGCGTGGQTLTLAQGTTGKITAIDLYPTFIEMLNERMASHGFDSRVKGEVCSMEQLPFEASSLDLIWCEGAIYNLGFERGLREWHPFLKTGGYIAISESSWFSDVRPQEIHDFWMNAYTEIDTIPNQISTVYRAGYLPVGFFTFPESCWIDEYFELKKHAEAGMLAKYADDKIVHDLIVSERFEETLYRKYKAYYGYSFFIAQKSEVL